MPTETGPERPGLPTHTLTVDKDTIPWYDAIAHSLGTFPDSSISLTSTPLETGVQIEATGSDRDISRFRRLTSILRDSLSQRATAVETRARIIETLDLMRTQTQSPS